MSCIDKQGGVRQEYSKRALKEEHDRAGIGGRTRETFIIPTTITFGTSRYYHVIEFGSLHLKD